MVGTIMDVKNERHIRNVEIFHDTRKLYGNLLSLRKAIVDSVAGQKLYFDGESYDFSRVHHAAQGAKVVVSNKRSLEAAMPYARNGKRVCVLNFASAKNPGGGVTWGASTQEEAICRCSTLYAALSEPELMHKFYEPHRKAGNPLNNDDCIYTPGVIVFKTDTSIPELMPEEDWYKVDIISCAAPKLAGVNRNFQLGNRAAVTPEQLKILQESRIKRIFELASHEENEVLILGAFGCGDFRNPPEIVASVFREVQEEYRNVFETIEYAVYHTQKNIINYKAFQNKIL